MMPRGRRKRRLASRIRAYVRGLLAFLFSNVGVIVLVVAYTIAGAFMFQAIEGGSEMALERNMIRNRDNITQHLWHNVTLVLNLFNETALKERISAELVTYQSTVVRAVRGGWEGGRSSRQWSFSSAFLYSLTVITTIGYGHLHPRTDWGKVITILYALLGMPLFLLYLTNVGELLARWFKCLYALVCLCRGCPGFTRRRMPRPRLQYDLSEPESIERPQAWRSRFSDSDVTPDYQVERYPRTHPREIPRNVSRDLSRDFSREIPREFPRLPKEIAREFSRDLPRDCLTDFPREFPRRPDYIRSVSMPQHFDPRVRLDPRIQLDPRRGWSEPVPFSPESESEFSYVTFDAQTITVPISVCVAIMVGYIMFGSMIFGMWEKWDQLDGAYFCFISLSSIGFGDFVPGERVYSPRIDTSFIVCSMYLMLGMALVAMCFNLMQEQVIHYFAGLKRALKRISRCKR